MRHLNEKAVTCKRTEHQNAPACICFSLHFVQRGSSMRNQSSDRINTNSKHAEEETNKMLRNQVKWCQSRGELTPNALLNLLSISIEVYMKKMYIWFRWSPRHQSVTYSLTVTWCLNLMPSQYSRLFGNKIKKWPQILPQSLLRQLSSTSPARWQLPHSCKVQNSQPRCSGGHTLISFIPCLWP